ncbi:MAG: hypothetical protein JO241_08930, partial [Candidatus Eremiobacteraeota bacterium]|nr:hypothetical protein [Candidatus Eremiobacteraeota bacterium]
LFYGNNNGVHGNQKRALIFFLTHSRATKIIGNLEYTPLSPAIVKAAFQAGLGSNSGKGPCMN